jgi:hypothetical protein
MKNGQKLEYIGKGFVGFHKDYKTMTFVKQEGNEVWVNYHNPTSCFNMVVSPHEVKPV